MRIMFREYTTESNKVNTKVFDSVLDYILWDIEGYKEMCREVNGFELDCSDRFLRHISENVESQIKNDENIRSRVIKSKVRNLYRIGDLSELMVLVLDTVKGNR